MASVIAHPTGTLEPKILWHGTALSAHVNPRCPARVIEYGDGIRFQIALFRVDQWIWHSLDPQQHPRPPIPAKLELRLAQAQSEQERRCAWRRLRPRWR